MNPRTRLIALYAIGAIAILASANALAHSYAGLYDWASTHRLNTWQSLSWPAEIDVFLIIGELALYVAYLDNWSGRHKLWPWITTAIGLIISIAGNVGHIQPLLDHPVTAADRLTAATSPLAAFAGLTIGLLVLKMTRWAPTVETTLVVSDSEPDSTSFELITKTDTAATHHVVAASESLAQPEPNSHTDLLLDDADKIVREACARSGRVSQRYLAAQLRARGHHFSNAQLRGIAKATSLMPELMLL